MIIKNSCKKKVISLIVCDFALLQQEISNRNYPKDFELLNIDISKISTNKNFYLPVGLGAAIPAFSCIFNCFSKSFKTFPILS